MSELPQREQDWYGHCHEFREALRAAGGEDELRRRASFAQAAMAPGSDYSRARGDVEPFLKRFLDKLKRGRNATERQAKKAGTGAEAVSSGTLGMVRKRCKTLAPADLMVRDVADLVLFPVLVDRKWGPDEAVVPTLGAKAVQAIRAYDEIVRDVWREVRELRCQGAEALILHADAYCPPSDELEGLRSLAGLHTGRFLGDGKPNKTVLREVKQLARDLTAWCEERAEEADRSAVEAMPPVQRGELGAGKDRPPILWAEMHCPVCGQANVSFLSQAEFARRAHVSRDAVARRIKKGQYWADATRKVPWCSNCGAKTPEGEGRGPMVGDEGQSTPADEARQRDLIQWLVDCVEKETGTRPDPDSPDSPQNEYLNAAMQAVLQAERQARGELTRDQVIDTAKRAIRQCRSDDTTSRVFRSAGDMADMPD